LKFLSTVQVFCEHPEADEDGLHANRMKIICNYGLLRMTIKHEIHEFILGKSEGILPISFEEIKKASNQAQLNSDLILSKDDLKDKNMQQFNKKILADVLESLTGQYYLHHGLEGCEKFLYFTEVLAYPSLYIKIPNNPVADYSNIKYIVHLKNELTKIFAGKYEIKNIDYFVQAFTHTSFRKNFLKVYSEKRDFIISIEEMEAQNAGKEQESNKNYEELDKKVSQQAEEMKKIDGNLSYERLEFLGDSILDYYIVSYLFQKYPDNDSGIHKIFKFILRQAYNQKISCSK
jgi:dsRNA-specific ribonuclease